MNDLDLEFQDLKNWSLKILFFWMNAICANYCVIILNLLSNGSHDFNPVTWIYLFVNVYSSKTDSPIHTDQWAIRMKIFKAKGRLRKPFLEKKFESNRGDFKLNYWAKLISSRWYCLNRLLWSLKFNTFYLNRTFEKRRSPPKFSSDILSFILSDIFKNIFRSSVHSHFSSFEKFKIVLFYDFLWFLSWNYIIFRINFLRIYY